MAVGSRKHRTRRLHKKHGLDTGHVRNEINVTPLVDVCLVLLIIFMVILPMMTRGKDVPLPQTRHHDAPKDKRQPIVSLVQDMKTGRLTYYIDQEEIPVGSPSKPGRFAKLQKKLRDAQELANFEAEKREKANPKAEIEMPGRSVYLKAGADLTYEKIFPVLMALHEAYPKGEPGVKIEIGTNEVREK